MYIIFRVDNQSAMMDALPIDLIASISSHLPIVDICHLVANVPSVLSIIYFHYSPPTPHRSLSPSTHTAFAMPALTVKRYLSIERSRRHVELRYALVRCAKAGHLLILFKNISQAIGVFCKTPLGEF